MGMVKKYLVLTVLGIGILLLLAGCETKKHAAVMSGETLEKKTPAVSKKVSPDKEKLPLTEPGVTQEPLEVGKLPPEQVEVAKQIPPSGFTPSLPQQPTGPGELLTPPGPEGEVAPEAPAGLKFFPSTPDMPTSPPSQPSEVLDEPPIGLEGQEFVQQLGPSDFQPEHPTQPGLRPFEKEAAAPSPPGDEESVRIPRIGERMAPLQQPAFGQEPGVGEQVPALSHVYFDFDKFAIRADAVPVLETNTRLLNNHYQDSTVLIQGHCDERGTSEYNLVLGERRARAVKEYLVDLGIERSRIDTISYGEERPSCTEHQPSCWQLNRRGHFLLK